MASFSRYLLSRRRMSMARWRAVVINHAPGLSGMPCSGHFSKATTRLSWTTSSARSKSPSTRTSAAVKRPASSLKTEETCPLNSVEFTGTPATLRRWRPCSSALPRVLDYRPDLDRAAGPGLRHLERLVEVLDVDEREPADDLFGLDERPVRDGNPAVLARDGGRRARALELFAANDLAGLRVLLEPLAGRRIGGHRFPASFAFQLLDVLHRAAEQQDVFHRAVSRIKRSLCRLTLYDERGSHI